MTQSAKPSIKQAVARRIGVARALSKLGVASRTIAAQWVRAGRVRLNGRIVRDPESPVVLARDNLSVDGQPVRTTGLQNQFDVERGGKGLVLGMVHTPERTQL